MGRYDHDLVSIKRDERKFIFTVEMTGAPAPEDSRLYADQDEMECLQEEVRRENERSMAAFYRWVWLFESWYTPERKETRRGVVRGSRNQ